VQSWGELRRFLADGGQTPGLRAERTKMQASLAKVRRELVGAAQPSLPVRAVDAAWVQRQIEKLGDLLRKIQRAKTEIARHLDGAVVLSPIAAPRGRRAEISGSWKPNGLLAGEPTRRPVAQAAGCGGWI
jgi:hypothetical protein